MPSKQTASECRLGHLAVVILSAIWAIIIIVNDDLIKRQENGNE